MSIEPEAVFEFDFGAMRWTAALTDWNTRTDDFEFETVHIVPDSRFAEVKRLSGGGSQSEAIFADDWPAWLVRAYDRAKRQAGIK
ncbi:hypothetical protein [Agrococcus sp. DT81.2]|uniref:hypothetical protein n=1 Tax=Agrococcus sp. DT81.2 TaxID=3393414 RepID=UPI003CE570F7